VIAHRGPLPATVLASVCCLLGAPFHAAAQTGDLGTETTVRVSPFIGYSPGFRRLERRKVVLQDRMIEGDFETRFGTGMAAGLLFEVRSAGPLRISAGAFVLSRSEAFTGAPGSDASTVGPGVRHAVAKVALAVRLNESVPAAQIHRLNTSLFAGPAYVLELPRRDRLSGLREGTLGTWAVNWGADAEFPLGRIVAVHVGLEDFAVLWSRRALERRVDAGFARAGLPARTTTYVDPSHMWLLRAALTLVF
jgi:hypothetical protein